MYGLWGLVALGAVLDSVANAIVLVTPMVASIGTASIVLVWFLAYMLLPSHPLPWVIGNQRVLVRKLGVMWTAYAVGIVVLLWIPSALQLWIPLAIQPPADTREIVGQLIKAHERELTEYRQREYAYKDQVKGLTEAVNALARRGGPGIADALAELRQGRTAAAERAFQDLLARKISEGQAANQQAAEAARHLGVLAFLHDTKKALQAYRQAVHLDPENAEGWNRLGHLLYRTGQLDKAADAYNQVNALGTMSGDQNMLATAYANLGNVYQVRGDLDQAEAM
jgi:tetratricopeptide (TPR) repeat protein